MMPVLHPRPAGVLPMSRYLLLLTMSTARHASKYKGPQRKHRDPISFAATDPNEDVSMGPLSPQLQAKVHPDVLPSIHEMEQRMERRLKIEPRHEERTRIRGQVARLVDEQIWDREA